MKGLPPLGSRVADYRLLALIGEGATGAVYRAERADDAETVALKLLDPELARDERFRQRFLRESTLASELHHPGSVPIVDFGESDGVLYLAMRNIDGGDLRALLGRDGALEPARALALLAAVGDALDAAHQHGLVHRDIKPANILLESGDGEERAYLADFGLAKHASSVSSLSADHMFVGTLAYVSPEQIRGEPIDARADIYSLGCVLYECLAGSPPFDRESELAVVYAHLNERPMPLSDIRPGLPAGIDGVLQKAMAKAPDERFDTCAEMIGAARAALAGARFRKRRIGPLLIGGACVAVAAVGAIAIAERGGSGSDAPPRLPVGGSGLAVLNGQRVAARIRLPERPRDVVFGKGSAWATQPDARQIAQIALPSRRRAGVVGLPFVPGGIAFGGGALYATEQGGPGVAKIDPRTRKVAARWTAQTHGYQVSDPTGIAVGAGSVWVARGAEVVRLDVATGREQHRFALPVDATLLTFAGDALWAASSENGLVEKIDPATNRIAARAALHGWISGLAVAAGSVWATVTPDDVVFRLSVDDASVEGTLPAGRDPESLTSDSGSLWIANSRGRALTQIRIRAGTRRTIALTGAPDLVRAHRGGLWVGAEAAPAILPKAAGGELRVSVQQSSLATDPAAGADPVSTQMLYPACLKLVNYPDAAGSAGQRLVPDGAASLPTVSADGRTYTFRIRSGMRFSPPSSEVVDARTFKHSLERARSPRLGPNTPGAHALADVTSIRATGNRLLISLTYPAGDLLARLALPYFCAVPSSTPDPTRVHGLIPSAGPYYVRSQSGGQTVLERNPGYHGTRPRRVARIVYSTGVPTTKAAALAQAGRVDVMPFDYDPHGPLVPGGALDRRFGAPRYRIAPAPGVDMIAFNTKSGLFASRRLRQAVSFALDRRALAAVFQEPPTDHYVPPGVPGSSPASVYPMSPQLARAKALARGVHGRARLYFCGEAPNLRIAQIIRNNLKPLGIRVAITQSLGCLNGPDPKATGADMALVTRATLELDPAPFMRGIGGDSTAFGPGTGFSGYADPRFRARLAKADALQGEARLRAYQLLEEDLNRRVAPYASFGAFVAPEYLSARVRCILVQGAYHVVDLGALCT